MNDYESDLRKANIDRKGLDHFSDSTFLRLLRGKYPEEFQKTLDDNTKYNEALLNRNDFLEYERGTDNIPKPQYLGGGSEYTPMTDGVRLARSMIGLGSKDEENLRRKRLNDARWDSAYENNPVMQYGAELPTSYVPFGSRFTGGRPKMEGQEGPNGKWQDRLAVPADLIAVKNPKNEMELDRALMTLGGDKLIQEGVIDESVVARPRADMRDHIYRTTHGLGTNSTVDANNESAIKDAAYDKVWGY